MSQDQIHLPEPDLFVAHGRVIPKTNDLLLMPAWSATFFGATTVRRLIAEAVAAEREACAKACESRAPCNGRMDEWDAAAMICAAAIRARSAAESTGELPPTDRSAEDPAHPGLCALDASPRAGGLACDRLPERVPPGGMEREGELSTPDHQSGHRHIAGSVGVLGGLAAERCADGVVAEGVSNA